ncbi:hypothetical protein COCMIDRAFT_88002 [Bipolaris oryzae ATCC 44560]|uniref:RING-type domain-containing protein n=1 Tax=Bipolaris oryzae ATCC 44560 TaxID=930090 RepID=W6ZWM3_COCMI|nr:uncharacterized protein COCMIDRAFT_88002 [Bipolaris oryzae ATCC 44560]EUC48191.1 hypothetical protein COCMIDRAFT_88002 [Bipolaris oryzae ATCC 44560]
MPAVSGQHGVHFLHAREWQKTVGNSGMTPTAFSFLIPVFVVAIIAPFLCIFCIRKRRRTQIPVTIRPTTKVKKPALRREEAREKLKEVTEVPSQASDAGEENRERPEGESQSISEKECAICLSALYLPSPPEPAKLSPETPAADTPAPSSVASDQPQSTSPTITTTATTTATSPTSTPQSDSEPILKLTVCSHEFHAECLVSWFVLRKTSCPICRSMYMSKEEMDKYDEEEQIALGGTPSTTIATPTPDLEAQQTAAQPEAAATVRNWQYFLYGRDAYRRARERRARTQGQSQPAVEMQTQTTTGSEESQQSDTDTEAATATAQATTQQPEQPTRSRWQRLLRRG